MTRESFWKKWGQKQITNNLKMYFMEDLNELIEKHQAPYVSALDNISMEIRELTTGEMKDAEATSKRLG